MNDLMPAKEARRLVDAATQEEQLEELETVRAAIVAATENNRTVTTIHTKTPLSPFVLSKLTKAGYEYREFATGPLARLYEINWSPPT